MPGKLEYRKAEIADLPEILVMVHSFYIESEQEKIIGAFDAESMAALIYRMTAGEDGVILLCIQDGEYLGMLAGQIAPNYIKPSVITAIELVWWVHPDKRGTSLSIKLIKKFEAWAKEKGATHISVCSLQSSEPEKVDKLYTKLNYAHQESVYIKVI